IIYHAHPSTPTGTAFSHAELEEFLGNVRDDVLVVLDEAYIHYAERADMPGRVELYRRHKNLLILRTFSKVYGLAGQRVGYAIGQEGYTRAFNQLKTPFNTSNVGQAAALAALDDAEHVRRSIENNQRERRRLVEGLKSLGLREGGAPSSDPIAEILKNTKTIAVVGLSSNAMRPSHGVAEYLQAAGYRIVPVNPNETNVLGEKSYPRLEDVPLKIDLVDIFRRAEFVPPVADGAVRAGAKGVRMEGGSV